VAQHLEPCWSKRS
jgi:hypothetical protein